MKRLPSWLVVTLSVVLLGTAGGGFGFWLPQQFQAGPRHAFALDMLPEGVVEHYHFAETHQAFVAQIPCYCGCGPSLGHRYLKDCYLARTGIGYSDHAAYCGICDQIAADAATGFNAGDDAATIRTAVDAKFGQIGRPTNTP